MARRYWVKIGGRKHALTRRPTPAEARAIAGSRRNVVFGYDDVQPKRRAKRIAARRNPSEALLGLHSAADMVKAFGNRMFDAGRSAARSDAARPAARKKPKGKYSPNLRGFNDARAGKARSANPYAPREMAHRLWLNGWTRYHES